jgi:tRNA 2-thiouridine synthesizing protein C
MVKSLVTLILKPPYGVEDSFAGLMFSLSQIASGIIEKSDVVLIHDGVYNAKSNQKPEAIEMPSIIDIIDNLKTFGCKIYCIEEDLKEREIEDVVEGVEIVKYNKLRSILDEYDEVITF